MLQNLFGDLALDDTIKEWFKRLSPFDDESDVLENDAITVATDPDGLPVEVIGAVTSQDDVVTSMQRIYINTTDTNGITAAQTTKILSANSSRKVLTVYNENAIDVYIGYLLDRNSSPVNGPKFGYWLKMNPGDYWEMPRPIYVGDIYIFIITMGTVRISEGS